MRTGMKHSLWRIALAASGTVLFLNGCDAQTRATVESGIITSSSSLLAAILRAVIELAGEAQSDTTTAQAALDLAQRILA